MHRNELVRIPNVLAIGGGPALICEMKGRRVGVPVAQIAARSQVRSPGDYGDLVIPRWLAVNLDLI